MDIDWDNIKWDTIDVDEVIRLVNLRLRDPLDADNLNALVEAVTGVAKDWEGTGSPRTRLPATRQLVTLLHRQIDLSEAGDCDALTAADPLYDLAEDANLGPVAQDAFAALLRALEQPDSDRTAEDLLGAMFSCAPGPVLAAKLAEAAARAEDDALSLAILAARGNPEHAPALLTLLEADDDIPWTDESVVAAVIELGGRAEPIMARLAEGAPSGGEYIEDHYQVLGEPLLPYLKDSEEPWIIALVARIRAPWECMPRTFSAIIQLLPMAPSLWPDFAALLRDKPALLDLESSDAHTILCAVADAGCPAGDLLPKFVEIGVIHEAWMALLALGPAARSAAEAHVAGGDLSEEAVGCLAQVVALWAQEEVVAEG